MGAPPISGSPFSCELCELRARSSAVSAREKSDLLPRDRVDADSGNSAAGRLDRAEGDHRELVGEVRLQFVVARDGKIALGLYHQEARRHADVEPLLLGI